MATDRLRLAAGKLYCLLSFMKREFSPVYLALILALGCVTFRLLSSHFPGWISNISPLMAIAYVGGWSCRAAGAGWSGPRPSS